MTPVEALQAALAGEHAAVYVYGVLGAQASQSQQPALYDDLTAAYDVHRAQRDELNEMVSRHGADPVPAAVAYDLPNAAATAPQQMVAALDVERRAATVYGQLVAGTAHHDRRWAITALSACALRQLRFGGSPGDFPGLT